MTPPRSRTHSHSGERSRTHGTNRMWPYVAIILLGCASTPGAHPHDMSTAGHETAARQNEHTADLHQALYDPTAKENEQRCLPGGRDSLDGACWNTVRNPTEAHQREAERYRRAAADHRAASAALRDAEAKACAGLAPDDRDASPFTHVEDIVNVRAIVLDRGEPTVTHRTDPPEHLTASSEWTEGAVGAAIRFRAVPGLTAATLQKIIDCHIARNAALGHNVPEMPDCPLVPRGVQARVAETRSGLEVELRASDEDSAREVLVRAGRLVRAQVPAP